MKKEGKKERGNVHTRFKVVVWIIYVEKYDEEAEEVNKQGS
jgi:hypothetical protein